MKFLPLSAVLILLFVTACNSTFEVGIEHDPAGTPELSTNPVEVQAPIVTLAPAAETDSQTAPTSSASTDIQSTPAISPSHLVKMYMIALDDNGQTGIPIGCGDSAVPVMVEILPTQAVLKAALEELLSIKGQFYGESGLYNALYQSDLRLDSVSIDNTGKASVYLTGSLIMGGECDTPRVQAQLEQTVRQFPTVIEVEIFINGRPITEVLSLKG
jgi:hypothetical protein